VFEGLFQPTHLILVLAIVLIVFGPGKLPEAGKALGHAIRDFKKALNEPSADPKLSAAPKENAEDGSKSRSA
jgi:sec-independent protein translocase protein TatA